MLACVERKHRKLGVSDVQIIPNFASEADREQQFELGADVDSFAELRCRHVPMNLRVSNSVLQYATSLVESISEARGSPWRCRNVAHTLGSQRRRHK